MHPAPSVIVFSTLSGLGFGLLAWLGIDPTPPTGWIAFIFFAIGFGLAVGGLMASTFHLGHPERALKAFSQWRTSWLSREGICAVAGLCLTGLYAAALIFFGFHIAWLGWIGAALSLGTVFTTAMIYAQLKTVPRWHTPLTPALFLTISVAGGALLSGRITAACGLMALALLLQLIWWRRGDGAFATAGSTLGTATGLGTRGETRSLAHPHTAPNYLMKELVHQIGRKHATRLRAVALICGFVLPVAILALMMVLPVPHVLALVAVVSHIAGIAASRWLFFAEAEHVVGLYYGAR